MRIKKGIARREGGNEGGREEGRWMELLRLLEG